LSHTGDVPIPVSTAGTASEGNGEVRRHTTAAAALWTCAAFLAGCAEAPVESVAAAATLPAAERTDEVRCREAELRLESLLGALETIELANITTFDSAHAVTTSALESWATTFADAPDGPLAEAHESGGRKLAHLGRLDATTPEPDLLAWTSATIETANAAQRYCDELTTDW
jgi:hypothetical protein